MYWLDTLILILLAFGAILGALTGFLWQLSRVISVILGLYCSIVLNSFVAPIIKRHLMPESTQMAVQVTAYVVVFVTVCLLLLVLSLMLNGFVKRIRLQWLNRLLGSVFGAIKLGFGLGVVFLGLSYLPGMNLVMGQSRIAPVLVDGIKLVGTTIPEEYAQKTDEKIRKQVKNNTPKMALPQHSGVVNHQSFLADRIIRDLSTTKE